MSAKESQSGTAFTPERLQKAKSVIARYERPQSALLPVLYLAQEQFGYLSPPVMEYVAGLVDMPPAHVFDAVSFYSMFRKKDMGRFCLQICHNVTCSMMGSGKLIELAKRELGIDFQQVTADGTFSLVRVECLGACDKAPVVQVNEDYHEGMTTEAFGDLIRKLRGQDGGARRPGEERP